MDKVETPVVIVDDDPEVLRALSRLLVSMDIPTATFGSGDALMAAHLPARPEAILLDLHMPGLRGGALVDAILRRWPGIRIIVMTGHDRPGSREEVIGAGASVYINKPVEAEDVVTLLRRS